MPLSEHEQRALEQIEQALYREDRRLTRLARSSDPRVHYRRRLVQAAFGLAVGAGMVAAGVVLSGNYIYLAVGGFAVILQCGILALSGWRHMAGMPGGEGDAVGGGRRPLRRGRGRGNRRGGRWAAIQEHYEERWRRRQEGGG
ncbi:MAG TPA: DUF3040 domain-containing protein [Trebonia sp.]|nr:DUF3040 domain-containing protein [Trebonia sp.]